MPRKVTLDDIRQINEIYYKCHNYAETSRQTGWSASTVRAYVDKNFNPIIEDDIKRFNPDTDMPEFSMDMFMDVENFGDLCVLSDDEYEEIKELWKELPL